MYAADRITIIDQREMLRVKVISLADEARTIRKAELRTWGLLQERLHLHRVNELRAEARHAHIAYGLIRGRALERMERANSKPFDANRVRQLLKKYGPKDWEKLDPMPATVTKAA